MQRRSLKELVNLEEPGWVLVEGWIAEATNRVEVLPARERDRGDALVKTQVTTRSPMGAVIYETGGILIDNGWLRVLGSGHERLSRSLPDWNATIGNELAQGAPPFLLVADDVVGGFFAVDGGPLGAPGSVFYFAPDTLQWESLNRGYGDFLYWCLTRNLNEYYSNARWDGWENEVAEITGDQGFSIYPPLFSDGEPVGARSRKAVPVVELWNFANNAAKQLQGVSGS